jgi:peptidoglycan hydrolase-like protein with peptidoglycan-binding domain
MLRKAGYDVRATGVFDRETKNAIAQFQEKLGLWADGVVGTRTKALLFQVAG